MYHAWFSNKQKQNIINKRTFKKYNSKPHTNIYMTTDGREIEITEVSENMTDHSSRFSDSQYLGMVTKWVRPHYT